MSGSSTRSVRLVFIRNTQTRFKHDVYSVYSEEITKKSRIVFKYNKKHKKISQVWTMSNILLKNKML